MISRQLDSRRSTISAVPTHVRTETVKFGVLRRPERWTGRLADGGTTRSGGFSSSPRTRVSLLPIPLLFLSNVRTRRDRLGPRQGARPGRRSPRITGDRCQDARGCSSASSAASRLCSSSWGSLHGGSKGPSQTYLILATSGPALRQHLLPLLQLGHGALAFTQRTISFVQKPRSRSSGLSPRDIAAWMVSRSVSISSMVSPVLLLGYLLVCRSLTF